MGLVAREGLYCTCNCVRQSLGLARCLQFGARNYSYTWHHMLPSVLRVYAYDKRQLYNCETGSNTCSDTLTRWPPQAEIGGFVTQIFVHFYARQQVLLSTY